MANYIAMLAGQANKEITFNDLAFNLSPAAIFGINTNNTAGLSVCLFGGKLTKDIKFDDLIYLTLTANATNYVSANVSTKQVTVNTVEFDGVPLWKFITNANSITNLNTADERAHSLFTPDSSIVLATQTVAGLVKTSPTVFLDLNNQLDVAVDDVTIKKDANGKLYSVASGGGGGGAGLTYFKEVKNDTAPNETIPLYSFVLGEAVTETSADVFFGRKGNGSYIFFNGGANKVGRNSVDFTSNRTLATQIVSGNASGGGGQSMTISSNFSFGWGYKNTVSNDYSVAFGMDNTVSGSKSFAFGNNNTVSGSNSGAWGDTCEVTSNNSLAVGFRCESTAIGAFSVGSRNINRSKYSIICGEGGNTYGVDGDLTFGGRWDTDTINQSKGSAQTRIHRYKNRISSSSTLSKILIEATSKDTNTPSGVNQFYLVSNQVRSFKGKVLMIQENSTAIAEFEIKGLIKRPGTASTTELLQSTITQTFADTTATERGFSVSLSANTTLGCLTITCSTANYSSTIYCYAKIESDDVISAW